MAVLTRPSSALEVQKAKPGTTDYELFVITSGKKNLALSLQMPRFGFRNHHYPGVFSRHATCQRPDTAR